MAKKPAKNFDMMIGSSPVLVHVPHGSSVLPDVALGSLVINDDEVASELQALTNFHTDTLASYLHSHTFEKNPFAFINRVSRLAADPATLITQNDQSGMGAVYTKGSKGQEIRVNHEGIRSRLMNTYYEPYTRSFSFFSKNVIANHGRVIILNLHSYSSTPLEHEENHEANRPDICIGTDDFHTPGNLVDAVQKSFEASKYKVDLNSPFNGTFVPAEFVNKNTNVMAITINIRKDVYMDEKTGKLKDDEFTKLRLRLYHYAIQSQQFRSRKDSMSIRKKITYLTLIVSSVMMLYLFLWDEAFVKAPINQSDCPPNAGVAPDGTCGLYEAVPSIGFIAAGIIALIGFILLVIDVQLRKKARK